MKEKKKFIFWAMVVILLVLLTIMFTVRTVHKYEIWKGHEGYLKSENRTIEDWMPPNLIEKRTGIPKDLVYNELRIEGSFTNDRKPLGELCRENNLNCSQVVAGLNSIAGKQIERGT